LTAMLAAPKPIGQTTPNVADFTSVELTPGAGNVGLIVTAAATESGIVVTTDAGEAALDVIVGNVLLTAGDVVIDAPGGTLRVQGGAVTDFIGTAVLGAAGTATVLNTNIAGSDRIFLSRSFTDGTPGFLTYAITPATNFVITSSTGALDEDAIIEYLIIGQP